MRILVVSHMFPNLGNPAEGCFVAEQVKELSERCDAEVVSPLPAVPRLMRKLRPRWDGFWRTPFHETVAGVEVYRPRFFCLPRNASLLLDGFSYRAGVQRVFDQLCRKSGFDIVHVHSAIPDGFGVVLMNRRHKVPIVLNIHGRDINKIVRMSPVHRRLVGRVLARVDTTIVVSEKLKRQSVKLFPDAPEPVVVHNGIDTTVFASAGDEASAMHSGGGPCLAIVGNLLVHKNHKAVISAVSRLQTAYPRIRLKIAGIGPEEKNLRSLCRELGVSERVEFLGLCSRRRVRQLMSECDVFVMPSWDEAFGIVYIEAMSQGKPVIGSRGEGIADTITDGETGFLVDPHDVNELTEKIRLLIENRELAQRVGNVARELVFREFTWKKNVDRLMDVYREVLEEQRPRGA